MEDTQKRIDSKDWDYFCKCVCIWRAILFFVESLLGFGTCRSPGEEENYNDDGLKKTKRKEEVASMPHH